MIIGWLSSDHVLGAVITGKNTEHTVFIYARNVARSLGFGLNEWTSKQRYDMARAAGKVITHELIHAVAPSHPHASEGIMQHHLDYRSLTGSEMKIDGVCRSAFLVALTEALGRTASAQ